MENLGNELQMDEIERLIGDLPNVASGNAHPVSPRSAKSCEGLSIERLHSRGNLMDGNIAMSNLHQLPTDQILTRGNSMPGNQSLTFAFGKLSLSIEAKDREWRSLQSHTTRLEDHFPDKQLFNLEASTLTDLSSSNHLPGRVHNLQMSKLGPQNSPSFGRVPEEYNRWQFGRFQPFEISSPVVPLTHELSNVPVPNLQFPVTSHHQQIIHDERSPHCYIQTQKMNHHQINWSYAEEEPFYRLHGRYPNLQHLHNQQLGCLQPFQLHENISSRKSCQNFKQNYFDIPISHRHEQSNHDPFAFRGASNQLNPVFSTQYRDRIQGMEKVPLQSFPTKILARNHGPGIIDAMKFVSVDTHKSLNHVDQNRVIRSNACVRRNNLTTTTELFYHDDINPSALFSDSANFNLMPQDFNSVDDITGRIYLMAKDQQGCRFLQRKFVEGTLEDIEKIFNEIIDHVVELMTDPFGNYLIQKLLEVCNEDQRMIILHKITRRHGELVQISCDTHGTRAIQRVIETLQTPEQFSMIVSSLRAGIVTLMKDINGNHVAQHCLQYLMPGYNEFLFDAARKCCVELATDRHGCCVLQKCLSLSDGRQRDSLISVITLNALVISQDAYGNYVVQFILKLGLPWATMEILEQLQGNFGDLSMQKFSSNVVEKCLEYAGEGHINKIVNELISDPRFDKIMQDPYGNYAIQKALHQSEGTLRVKLVDAIRPHVPVLRTSPYGKKVLSILGRN